jgi:hypothetical protein
MLRLLPVRCRRTPQHGEAQPRGATRWPVDHRIFGRPAGASLDIVCAFEGTAPKIATMVEVAGAPVRIELTYLGPLPA